MPGGLFVAIQIIQALLPLVSAGTKAYKDIQEATSAIKDAQAAGRDLTADDVAKFIGYADAAGRQIADLAAQAAQQEKSNA